MAELVQENSRVREIVPAKEKIDIQDIPQIIEWSNGSTPESTVHDVIQLVRNRNQPDWDDDRFINVCYEDLITEDDEPVDNIPSEKQQRLLAQSLYEASYLPEPFLVTANVGLFHEPAVPPIVPDVMVSLGVSTGDDPLKKENRSYFVWKEKKPPEVVVEIVSNKEGNETGSKFERYATIGVKYYVIIDEGHHAQEETLVVYELEANDYTARDDYRLPDLNLSLTFWEGTYEQSASSWVRWCNAEGDLLLTGKEQALQEKQRAENKRRIGLNRSRNNSRNKPSLQPYIWLNCVKQGLR